MTPGEMWREQVRAQAEQMRTARHDAKQRTEALHQTIRDALAAGCPAADLARAANITTNRVYQIRDER